VRRWLITGALPPLVRRDQEVRVGVKCQASIQFVSDSCGKERLRSPVASPASPLTKIRFDSFELDLSSGELRNGGNRLRLQPQPFRVLLLLPFLMTCLLTPPLAPFR
jgi:DNA-binding response OmpR family regulator